jgi:hypothetical protein
MYSRHGPGIQEDYATRMKITGGLAYHFAHGQRNEDVYLLLKSMSNGG